MCIRDSIGGIARNGIVPVAADAQIFQPVKKRVRRGLPAVPGQHHAAYIQPHIPENVNEPENVLIIGDPQIAPHFVLLDIPGIDGNDDLHIILELLEHSDLAVRRKTRQHPRGVVIIEQLAAEFQIQLAAALVDPLFNLLRLGGEVFLIVEADGDVYKRQAHS